MRYDQARERIQSGDVLCVYGRGFFAAVIRFVQRLAGLGDLSGVVHCGVAWWLDGRLYSVEMDGKHNVLRPVSQYVGNRCRIDVYACPVGRDAMYAHFADATQRALIYSAINNIRIGARLLFGIGRGHGERYEAVCSTLVSRWLQLAGWIPPVGFPDMPSPAEVARALHSPALIIESQT